MFSFGISPQASPARSQQWSRNSESTGASPSRSAGSPGSSSVASSSSIASSATSTGIKSRKIRDLKLEVELRDQRIDELERSYEEVQRKAAFAHGELQCVVEEQRRAVDEMSKQQDDLKSTIAKQSADMAALQATLQQYQAMHESVAAVMKRCAELESIAKEQALRDAERREQERREREAEKAEADRRLAEEAAKEQQRLEAQAAAAREAQEAARILQEEEERRRTLAQRTAPAPAASSAAAAPPSRARTAPPAKKNGDCIVQ